MKAMKPFYFTHPQYGKLRVVVIGGKIYYCLMDVKNIFKKSVQKLYETIADSEGELKNLNIMMMKDMKIKYNLFFENQEMGKEEAEAENVNADINFCDEQLVKDLVAVSYTHLGFPQGWENEPLWRQQQVFGYKSIQALAC